MDCGMTTRRICASSMGALRSFHRRRYIRSWEYPEQRSTKGTDPSFVTATSCTTIRMLSDPVLEQPTRSRRRQCFVSALGLSTAVPQRTITLLEDWPRRARRPSQPASAFRLQLCRQASHYHSGPHRGQLTMQDISRPSPVTAFKVIPDQVRYGWIQMQDAAAVPTDISRSFRIGEGMSFNV